MGKIDIMQLNRSVAYSRGALKPFRANRYYLLKQLAGYHYSDNGASDKVPINLLELALNIYLQQLIANCPRVSVTSDYPQLKEICTRFELAMNKLVREINLEETLALAVQGGMLSVGIVKVFLNSYKVEVGGYLHDAGQPCADHVTLDDWVHDMTVKRWEQVQYEGNRYRMTKDEALEVFKGNKDELIRNEFDRLEREENISAGSMSQKEEYIETIELWDLWLPKQNIVGVYMAGDTEQDPLAKQLRAVEWTGPERGPYHKLGFGKLEGNTMPTSPAMYQRDLHDLANRLYRKLGRQADRQKTVYGVMRGGDKDGQKIVEAEDGQMFSLDNPNNVQEIIYKGISPESLAFLIQTKEMFSYLAGNLDMLGGLGPQSDTLGQDQLLAAGASRRLQRMQKEMISFTTGVVEDLGYYLYNDPYIEIPLIKRIPQFPDVAVPVKFSPEDRENDFVEYNIKIEPFSMQHQSPENKLMGLRTVFSEFVAPLIPVMQQQGVEIDIVGLFTTIGKLANLPELNDVLSYSMPRQMSQPVGGMPTNKPPVTKRTYERINRPGATQPGKDQIMKQALLGSRPQKSEMSAIGRPTG
jgi:hypothetical protein